MIAIFEKIKQIFPNSSDPQETKNFKITIFMLLALFLLMFITAVLSFFLFVRPGYETVVPNLVGKDIISAIFMLQSKNLIPRITEIFSNLPSEKNMIIRQEPAPRTKVREGKEVWLYISKGVAEKTVGNYINMSIEAVKQLLDSEFAAGKQLIKIKELALIDNPATAGTVIFQEPAPGTPIVDEVTYIKLVVSQGEEIKYFLVDNYIGHSFSLVINDLAKSNIPFGFIVRDTQEGEKSGTIVSQDQEPGSKIPEGVYIVFEMAKPTNLPENKVFGLFTYAIPTFDVFVNIKVETVSNAGSNTLLAMKHPGGELTLPYIVDKDSEIVLIIADQIANKETATPYEE